VSEQIGDDATGVNGESSHPVIASDRVQTNSDLPSVRKQILRSSIVRLLHAIANDNE
jgi:hypothetical protein